MSSVAITIYLDENLLQEATQQGLLEEEQLSKLLKSELSRQKKAKRLFHRAEQLHRLDEKPSPEEILAEVCAVRANQAE